MAFEGIRDVGRRIGYAGKIGLAALTFAAGTNQALLGAAHKYVAHEAEEVRITGEDMGGGGRGLGRFLYGIGLAPYKWAVPAAIYDNMNKDDTAQLDRAGNASIAMGVPVAAFGLSAAVGLGLRPPRRREESA